MPAKPRPRLDERRDGEVRRPRLAVADFRNRVPDVFDRDFAARELEADRLRPDALELDRFDLVSPFSRRILFTVRAATSSARPPYRPDFFALCLMCLY
jgi:hypothetical protein